MITKEIIQNVKAVNKTVKYMQKYIKKHSKEVYQVDVEQEEFAGHLKFTIIFNPDNSLLKEVQEQLQMKK